MAILPIGATEPHGPHLPLDTDVTIALAQSRYAADALVEAGVTCLVLPPVAYGLTHYTEGFEGRIPTTENLAVFILERVAGRMPIDVSVYRVRVMEDADLWSDVYGSESL